MINKSTIGVVGLGRMGFRVAENLRDKGYQVVGYDVDERNTNRFIRSSMTGARSHKELCVNLHSQRIILFFLPAGKAVDDTINKLMPFLEDGDLLIDCGNSHYKDTESRFVRLEKAAIKFLDAGVSGGVKGARNGACLTIGGDRTVFEATEFLFRDIAAEDGYLYVGAAGWGHLAKTVHNGIEYGFLQAVGEGLHVMKAVADKGNGEVELARLCEVWCNGSIIESRIMADTVKALSILEDARSIAGVIEGGETGRWAQETARECGVPTPVLDAAVESRKLSHISQNFATKIIAAVRNVFGEHKLSTRDRDDL